MRHWGLCLSISLTVLIWTKFHPLMWGIYICSSRSHVYVTRQLSSKTGKRDATNLSSKRPICAPWTPSNPIPFNVPYNSFFKKCSGLWLVSKSMCTYALSISGKLSNFICSSSATSCVVLNVCIGSITMSTSTIILGPEW